MECCKEVVTVDAYLLHGGSSVRERSVGKNDFFAIIWLALIGDSWDDFEKCLALVKFRVDKLPCDGLVGCSEGWGKFIDTCDYFVLRNRFEFLLVHVVVALRDQVVHESLRGHSIGIANGWWEELAYFYFNFCLVYWLFDVFEEGLL